MRKENRQVGALRELRIKPNTNDFAEGSCTITLGRTTVLCTATCENRVPPFIKSGGWITAEYNMLPRSTHTRNPRERDKPKGRTMEIQRLIGRSLRSSVNLGLLGERQILIDCDVLQADGGTRSAAITGGYVALAICLQRLYKHKKLATLPIRFPVAAISCGVVDGTMLIDLDYGEDVKATSDINLVTNGNDLLEVQGTAEGEPFSLDALVSLIQKSQEAINTLIKAQKEAIALA